MALTKRQKDVLDFLADFTEQHGYSPSYDEIAQAWGSLPSRPFTSTSPPWKHASIFSGGSTKAGLSKSLPRI